MFKRLNERLEKFLEISAETRQKVVDARKEQAQKAMDKYAKAQSLADRHAKADIKPSSKGFETFNQSMTYANAEPDMISQAAFKSGQFEYMDRKAVYCYGDIARAPQGVYYQTVHDIRISDPKHVKFEDIDALIKGDEYLMGTTDSMSFLGKHIKDIIKQAAEYADLECGTEEELRDALVELCDSNYDYYLGICIVSFNEIKKDTPAIQAFDPTIKELICKGTYKCERPETLADHIVPHLSQYTDEELVSILDHGASRMEGYSNSLYPSGWDAQRFGSYPRRLMQALIASSEEDSAADLYNIYYKKRTFLNGCKDLLQAEVLDHPAPYALELIDGFEDDKEMIFDYIETLAKTAPQAATAIQKEVEHKLSRWE